MNRRSARATPVNRLLLLMFFAATAATACTDWDAKGGLVASQPQLTGAATLGADSANGETTGYVSWNGQAADAGASLYDAATDSDASEITQSADATATDGGGTFDAGANDVSVTADGDLDSWGPDVDAGPAADAGADTSYLPDIQWDIDQTCLGANRPFGCPCDYSAQCLSLLCTLGPEATVCSQPCTAGNCPEGWQCQETTKVCKPIAPADVQTPDAGTAEVDQGSDATATDDGGSAGDSLGDVVVTDAPDAIDDTALFDAPSPTDAQELDAVADAGQTEGLQDGGDDVWQTEGLQDSSDDAWQTEGLQDTGNDGQFIDWQGYDDAAFPDAADIYGGAINSCLGVYLLEQENCGKISPSAACVAKAATAGSLYANYLFAPLAECQTAICLPACATASDESCMNQCLGKNCAAQFLACVANNTSGSQDCATTFDCTDQYAGKLMSIASACYANGTPAAQSQIAGLIGCSSKPQTESCIPLIAKCYASPSADQGCKATTQCTQACAGNNPCSWACIGKAKPQSVLFLDALWTCSLQNCSNCNGDNACTSACLAQKCSGPLADCITD